MEIFKDAELIIDVIGNACPETAKLMREHLQKAIRVSCTADAKAKDQMFKDMYECLDQAEKDCPKMAPEIARLRDLVDDGGTIKCGGP